MSVGPVNHFHLRQRDAALGLEVVDYKFMDSRLSKPDFIRIRTIWRSLLVGISALRVLLFRFSAALLSCAANACEIPASNTNSATRILGFNGLIMPSPLQSALCLMQRHNAII